MTRQISAPLNRLLLFSMVLTLAVYLLNPAALLVAVGLPSGVVVALYGLLVAGAGLAVMSIVAPGVFARAGEWLAARSVGWGVAGWLAHWVVILRAGIALSGAYGLLYPAPLYVVSLGAMAWHLWAWRDDPIPPPTPIEAPGLPLLTGLFFAAAALLRDAITLWAFYYGIEFDSADYIRLSLPTGPDASAFDFLKTYLYPALNTLLRTGDSAWGIVTLQVVVSAAVIGYLVFVLARRHYPLAFFAGLLLALNTSIGVANRYVMTESLYISLTLLSLALLLAHFDTRRAVWVSLVAGVVIGLSAYIRPAGLYFGAVVVVAYLLFVRPVRVGGVVAAGAALVLAAVMAFNAVVVGQARLAGSSGWYYSIALMDSGEFSPSNGPASQALADFLDETCGLALRERDPYGPREQNLFFYGPFTLCIIDQPLAVQYESAERIQAAYFETVAAHPAVFARRFLVGLDRGLAYLTQRNIGMAGQVLLAPCDGCPRMVSTYRVVPTASAGASAFLSVTGYLVQPYLYLLPPGLLPTDAAGFHMEPLLVNLGALVAWSVSLVLIFIFAENRTRLLALGAAAFILYNLLVVIFVQTLNTRYSQPIAPFHALLAAALLSLPLRGVALGRGVWLRRVLAAGTAICVVVGVGLMVHTLQTDDTAYHTPTVQAEGYAVSAGFTDLYHASPAQDNRYYGVFFAYPGDANQPPDEARLTNAWEQSALPGYLQAADIAYVIYNTSWLAAQPEGVREALANPSYYEVLREFTHPFHDRAYLLRVVGEALAPALVTERVVLYPLLDGGWDVYALGDSGNGSFVYRLTAGQSDNGAQVVAENGWSLAVQAASLTITDADGETLVDGFALADILPAG